MTVTEKERRQLNMLNKEEIEQDAILAKSAGISYGQYKAGVKSPEGDSGYKVSPTEYVTRKTEQNTAKSVAFIKIR